MLSFENIENLVTYMFKQVNLEEDISVVANKELSVSIIQELLEYNNVILKYAKVDDYEYDKEYIVTLHDDCDSDSWDIAIESIYNYEKEMYFGTDGYVLFHEDVNSKAMLDMQNNENIELSGHDWFTIGEEDDGNDSEKDNEESEIEHTYTVNGKSVDKEIFDKYVSKFAPNLVDNKEEASDDDGYSISVKCNLDADEALEIIADMERRMMHMNDMFREMDCFRRLFNW